MQSRAATIDQRLGTLEKQQNAAGYGLRGDMAAARSRMDNNLAKAQTAMQNGDFKNAKRYLQLAAPDVEKLEGFLN